jgi:hypothetical protein
MFSTRKALAHGVGAFALRPLTTAMMVRRGTHAAVSACSRIHVPFAFTTVRWEATTSAQPVLDVQADVEASAPAPDAHERRVTVKRVDSSRIDSEWRRATVLSVDGATLAVKVPPFKGKITAVVPDTVALEKQFTIEKGDTIFVRLERNRHEVLPSIVKLRLPSKTTLAEGAEVVVIGVGNWGAIGVHSGPDQHSLVMIRTFELKKIGAADLIGRTITADLRQKPQRKFRGSEVIGLNVSLRDTAPITQEELARLRQLAISLGWHHVSAFHTPDAKGTAKDTAPSCIAVIHSAPQEHTRYARWGSKMILVNRCDLKVDDVVFLTVQRNHGGGSLKYEATSCCLLSDAPWHKGTVTGTTKHDVRVVSDDLRKFNVGVLSCASSDIYKSLTVGDKVTFVSTNRPDNGEEQVGKLRLDSDQQPDPMPKTKDYHWRLGLVKSYGADATKFIFGDSYRRENRGMGALSLQKWAKTGTVVECLVAPAAKSAHVANWSVMRWHPLPRDIKSAQQVHAVSALITKVKIGAVLEIEVSLSSGEKAIGVVEDKPTRLRLRPGNTLRSVTAVKQPRLASKAEDEVVQPQELLLLSFDAIYARRVPATLKQLNPVAEMMLLPDPIVPQHAEIKSSTTALVTKRLVQAIEHHSLQIDENYLVDVQTVAGSKWQYVVTAVYSADGKALVTGPLNRPIARGSNDRTRPALPRDVPKAAEETVESNSSPGSVSAHDTMIITADCRGIIDENSTDLVSIAAGDVEDIVHVAPVEAKEMQKRARRSPKGLR